MISEYHYNILGSESIVTPAIIVNARGPAAYPVIPSTQKYS